MTERVDRRLKLIALHQQLIALHQRMTKAGLTLDDLERLEKELVTGTSSEGSGEKVDRIARWPDVQQNGPFIVD